MTIKAILFDKDGTLIDFNATFAPATALVIRELAAGDEEKARRLAKAVEFDLDKEEIDSNSVLVAGSLENITAQWADSVVGNSLEDQTAVVDALYVKYSIETVQAFPWLLSTLDALRADNLPLGIATNDSETAAKAHMARLELTDRFTHIFGYDSGHGAKPDPGMVTAFAEALSLPPKAVMMVGDSSFDLKAGRAAGAVAVGVTSGHYGEDILAPHADHVLPDISALPALVRQLNGESQS